MIGYNFTESVRLVLRSAREHATRLHHPYVSTEHILLGILSEGEGTATAVLTGLDVQPDALRQAVERRLPPGEAAEPGPDFPYTSHAKKTLENAMQEARAMNHNYVASEHVLLGLLRTNGHPAHAALAEVGVTAERARAELARRLGTQLAPSPASAGDPALATAKRAQLLALLALGIAVLALAMAVLRR